MKLWTMSAVLVVLCLADVGRTSDVATLSFSAAQPSSHPHTIQAGQRITVDLSTLPKETTVFRAVLRLGRDEMAALAVRQLPVKVTLAGSDSLLPWLAPRFTAFDVTAAVRDAVKSGSGRIAFTVSALGGYQPGLTRLDVTCTAKARNTIGQVRALRAWHRAGQTFLTWQEVDPPLRAETITGREWKALQERLRKDPKQVRYRIYRSATPITAATIGDAELIDEILPLSCWNTDYYGIYPQDGDKFFRYVVEDGKQPVPPGTAIYVHNPAQAGKAYYAVSMAINGEEDLSAFREGNAIQQAVSEAVGPGEPVLQRIVTPPSFTYVNRPTLHYFVRWEAPPRCNMPSSPYDYLVAVPANQRRPAPVGLHLHCWGASLNGGFGWWYNSAQGAILISSNQIPYDWWTGYHENLGTGKSWSEGVIRDYTQARLLDFLDWAGTRWPIDRNRVFAAGNSMGGSGSPNFGFRHADHIAWVVSWVGVHDPAYTGFRSSYEIVFGLVPWKLNYQDNKTPAFTYFNDIWFVRQDPARESPLICFSNGKNDVGVGWPQARDFWKALQETRRPHVFVWGQDGHGQRAILPGARRNENELRLDVRLDRTLPAFTNCSLDDNPGNGDPKDGTPTGQSNLYLYWSDATIADEPTRWSMDLVLAADAPKDGCIVDVTPRRCQRFKPKPGTKVVWANTKLPKGTIVAYGEAVVDQWGLVTVPKLVVSKGGNRLSLRLSE